MSATSLSLTQILANDNKTPPTEFVDQILSHVEEFTLDERLLLLREASGLSIPDEEKDRLLNGLCKPPEKD